MLRLFALAAALPALPALAVDDAALAADDECDAAPGGSGCALSAVQVSAGRQQGNLNSGGNTSWSISSILHGSTSRTYDASCFGKVGSGSCGSKSSGGKCLCGDGCMGADGDCYPFKNRVVATDLSFRNVKWSNYRIYMKWLSLRGLMSATTASSYMNMGQDKFTLYELPGRYEGQKEYFLASAKWPDYVMAMSATGILTKVTGMSLYGTYATPLAQHHEPWDLKSVMMRVCSLRSRGMPEAVKIGSSVPTGGVSIWAYLKDRSYKVYGYWLPERMVVAKLMKQPLPDALNGGDPGEAGYWIPEPPIPAGLLPDC